VAFFTRSASAKCNRTAILLHVMLGHQGKWNSMPACAILAAPQQVCEARIRAKRIEVWVRLNTDGEGLTSLRTDQHSFDCNQRWNIPVDTILP
jgi:hypothetical protein